MKHSLKDAGLFLLIESKADESAEDVFSFLTTVYDPRKNDPDWGQLYEVGPAYLLESRHFYQVRTFAGSLGMRMMLHVRKGELRRAILICYSGELEDGFDLIDPNCPDKHVEAHLLVRK